MEPRSKKVYLFSDDYRTGSNPFQDTKSVKSIGKISGKSEICDFVDAPSSRRRVFS